MDLQETRAVLEEQLEARLRVSPHLSVAAGDPADVAQAIVGNESEIFANGLQRSQAYQIAQSLKKIDEDTYGICDGCQKPIPEERLEAPPSAIYCVSCQEKAEQEPEWQE